ncbi:MAG TPA: cation diffusion facilitator family transporter [Thermomicrobiales bacterium]|nr:cation diffusion facilitator family transporter [Thermomicrobiales bacterium]
MGRRQRFYRDREQHENAEQPQERVNRRPLALALAITAAFLVAEVIGGLLTNSLALLADAGHMATDVAALGLSLFAVWLARRPATPERSFGFYRAEVLAALVNAATLVAISFYIFWEAFQRIGEPPEVDSGPMLIVAIAGLGANAASAWILMRGGGHEHNLNTRGAFLHVVGDMLGSVGAITAALVMLATGWYLADPILSAGIGLLILWSSWRLLRESVEVLLEATPAHVDTDEVRQAMTGVEGVLGVHDLHVWTVTSGLVAMSSHIEVAGRRDWHDILVDLSQLLRDRFDIAHVTLQPEEPHAAGGTYRGCSLDSPEGLAACCIPNDQATGRVRSHHGHAH